MTPPYGWLNDPNGLSIRAGADSKPLLHLFYQANPDAPVHDQIHWGHQVSEDLVTWRDLPIALEPGDGWPDAEGCWSGVIVLDDGVPTAVYSGDAGGDTQVCCLATAVDPDDPDLVQWVKDPAGAVIAGPPQGLEVTEMRDHSVWREQETWYQIMGAGLRDGGGAALLYSSADLRQWRFEGVLAAGDAQVDGLRACGTVWECPELTRVGGLDVLNVSAWHAERTLRSVWMTGRLSPVGPGRTMEVGLTGSSDLGENYFYAPQSLDLPDGRHITIGWMQPALDAARAMEAGWAGSMSVPREVTLAEDGTLRFAPVAELTRLRRDKAADASDPPVGAVVARGRSLDVEITGRLGDDPFVLDMLASSDGARRTRLSLRRRRPEEMADGGAGQELWGGWLELDRSHSAGPASPEELTDLRLLAGEVPVDRDGGFEMRILIDRSSLEVFVNGQPLSARVGSAPADDGVVISSPCQNMRVQAWTMGEAYAGRLVPMHHQRGDEA